jgi:hypothetical protein
MSVRRSLARSTRLVLVSACLLLARSASADAQLVLGRVHDAVSSRPLDGAVVTLIVEADGAEISVFSDPGGTYRLRATRAGVHRVRIKRIGYQPFTSAPFAVDLTATVTVPEVALAPRPQVVEKVSIASDQQCQVNPREGKGVVDLWEDVRAALEATIMTASEQRFVLRYVTTERRLDTKLREVGRREDAHTARGAMVWASISAEQLAREGYVFRVGDDVMYRGLDARVLLSDSFLDTHCFKVAPKHAANDSLAGLAFEPVRRGSRIEVRGVLWLNSLSGELDSIDFTYEGLNLGFSTRELGGRVEFEQLPSGRWIVDRWWIRMPRIEQRQPLRGGGRAPGRIEQSLVGFDEVGGAVFDIMTTESAARAAAPRPVITGVIHDSSSGHALVGARVSIADPVRTATTDQRGWFSLDSVPRAELSLTATHPRLDSLTIGRWSWRIAADTALTRTLTLALPPLEQLLARLCPPPSLDEDAGVLAGRVGDAGQGVVGAAVRAAWLVTSVDASGVKRIQHAATATTGSDGSFAVCGVPTEATVQVEVSAAGYRAQSLPTRIPEALRWTRLDIGLVR